MTDLEMSDYWDDVAAERRQLIAETHQLYLERLALIEQRRQLVLDYVRLRIELHQWVPDFHHE
jgi:hypothetical protein